jgi:hypothetical protein
MPFLYDPVSSVWLYLLESQLKVCCSVTENREQNISGCEVAKELDVFINRMENRRDEDFHTSELISRLSDFEGNCTPDYGVSGLFPSSCILKKTTFRKLVLFSSSDEKV